MAVKVNYVNEKTQQVIRDAYVRVTYSSGRMLLEVFDTEDFRTLGRSPIVVESVRVPEEVQTTEQAYEFYKRLVNWSSEDC